MKYTAFISYNHEDDKWAKWLQKKLESYNMPVVIKDNQGKVIRQEKKPKHFRIFRYVSDLNTVFLNEGLAKELDESHWLIVICSPNSAKSAWVPKEIQHFLDTDRKKRIIPFIVNGTSYSDGPDECLPKVLRDAFPDGDILGVNINDYGDDPCIYRKRKAIVRTVSLLLEVPDAFNYLWNRYKIRFWERMVRNAIGLLLVFVSIAYAWWSNVSFDCPLRLNDVTLQNDYLPAPDSIYVSMLLDNEKKEMVVPTTNAMSTFRNIPGKYSNSDVKMTFHAYGYQTIDTVVHLQRNEEIMINIQRDDTYGILSGKIIDEDGAPVGQAKIDVEGVAESSAPDGTFEVRIPIEQQRPCPHVVISKQGYRREEYTNQSIGRGWSVMLRRED